MKKLYYCDKDGLIYLVRATKRPPYAVMEAPPEAEHAEDLDIITETDDMGTETKRIVVNAERRQARLDAEAAATLEAERIEAEKKAADDALKDKVKGWQNMSSKDKDDLLRAVVEKVLGSS